MRPILRNLYDVRITDSLPKLTHGVYDEDKAKVDTNIQAGEDKVKTCPNQADPQQKEDSKEGRKEESRTDSEKTEIALETDI